MTYVAIATTSSAQRVAALEQLPDEQLFALLRRPPVAAVRVRVIAELGPEMAVEGGGEP